MAASPEFHTGCVALLKSLVEALREAAPRLNEELPFPQRMAVTVIRTGKVRRAAQGRCTATLALRVGGASRSYRVELACAREPLRLTVSDETDFEEHLELATRPGQPPHPRDVRAFYQALATDIAGHFGTDS